MSGGASTSHPTERNGEYNGYTDYQYCSECNMITKFLYVPGPSTVVGYARCLRCHTCFTTQELDRKNQQVKETITYSIMCNTYLTIS